MCSVKEKTMLNNINRTLIAVIGGASTLVDGFHGGDVLCICSMAFWLLQPECTAVEEKVLDKCKAIKASIQ